MSKGVGRSILPALIVAFWTFIVSGTLNILSEGAKTKGSATMFIAILLTVIAVGIIFDIIGTAVTVAGESSLNAMAAKRIPGALQATKLVQKAGTVANFCNDFVGDVCGTLSGAMCAMLVFILAKTYNFAGTVMGSAIGIALVSALTVGGKFLGKAFAVNSADSIMLAVGKIFFVIQRITRIDLTHSSSKKDK